MTFVRERSAATAEEEPILVLGAGPAGLTAAYMLAKRGHRAIVFEAQLRTD